MVSNIATVRKPRKYVIIHLNTFENTSFVARGTLLLKLPFLVFSGNWPVSIQVKDIDQYCFPKLC